MSDYNNAWNQLFRLNPDTPQTTAMLSNQELQDELALWSNAQFQFDETTNQPTKDSRSSSIAEPSASSSDGSANNWGFMMSPSDAATTEQLLSALTSAPDTPQWSQAQKEQTSSSSSVIINGVPMVPLLPMPQQPNATLAPSPQSRRHHHHQTILPKATTNEEEEPSATSHKKKTIKKRTAPAKEIESVVDDGGEESRKLAAEEDKRRRNTAASARFRVKKKLKEQALERTAREMAAKAEALEKRVKELETETRWLKSLITDKDPSLISSLNNCVSCQHHQKPTTAVDDGLQRTATPLNIAPSPAFKKPRV